MKATANLASTVVLILLQLWICHDAAAYEYGEVRVAARSAVGPDAGRDAEILARHPEDLLSAFGAPAGSERATAKRIVSVLQKMGKTLILERTRGLKEVELYRRVAPAVVLVVTKEGFGSGAIVDGQGHVITNWHVVGTHPDVVTVFKPKDGTELKKELAFRASVEKVDQVADLALLKIRMPPKAFSSLALGEVSTLAVGQDVHAIGHPEGEVWTYTKGIISQIRSNYKWSTADDRPHQAKVIQTQTPVNPGNSGGPLLDDSGKIIGINSFRAKGEGLNYAVAVDEIQAFLQREGSRESPAQPALGVAREKPRCPDAYDTKRQGWSDIVGCYSLASAPPPDLWFVYRAPNQRAAYAALDSLITGEIDMIIKSQDQQWQRLEYYIDSDCNGTDDLIGRKSQGSGAIDGYKIPEKPLRLVTLAKELDSALKKKKIPYPKLRVCQ